MGPAGPAGTSPAYSAGWVRSDATVRFGTGFTVVRIGGAGGYQITIPATSTGRFLATVVTPNAINATARVVAYNKSALDGSHTITIEIRDATGGLLDSDFTFIAMDRS